MLRYPASLLNIVFISLLLIDFLMEIKNITKSNEYILKVDSKNVLPECILIIVLNFKKKFSRTLLSRYFLLLILLSRVFIIKLNMMLH